MTTTAPQSSMAATEPTVPSPSTATTHAVRSVNWKALAFVVLAAILVAEIVFVAPYLDRALSNIERPDLRWLGIAVITELISMGAFARVQRRMLSVGGARVPMCRMAALTYAANAVSVTLPGGAALSSSYVFKRLRSWGATVPAAGFTVVASGVLSTLSFALLAVVCAVLAGHGGVSSLLVVAGVGAAVIAVLVTRRHHRPDLLVRLADRGLARANRILHRAPGTGADGLHRIVGELSAIKPRNRDWLAGLSSAGLNWVADLACLAACCYAVGGDDASLVLVMVAYIAGMSASSLSLLPGGLGVVDAAMIFALTQGGVSTTMATAGVLLYRLISYALVVALGWLVWGASWLAEHRRADARAAPVTTALTETQHAAA